MISLEDKEEEEEEEDFNTRTILNQISQMKLE